MALSNHVKIFVFQTSADKKKNNAPAWFVQKIDFWGVHLEASEGGGTPKLSQNICRLNIYRYKKKKKLSPYLEQLKKINFLGPYFGGFWGKSQKKFQETKLPLQLNKFTQKLDFDVLRFRRRAQKI